MHNSETPLPPYIGLSPYTENYVPFFFGREVDTEVVTSNLRAAKLILLYGGSGVGKSSLLNAGVAHNLRSISESTAQRKGAQEFVVVIFRQWAEDPVLDLSKCVQEAVVKAFPDLPEVSVPPTRDLSQMLATWQSLTRATFFIILDQFEEYFQQPEKHTGEGSFAIEFPKAIACTDPTVKFLISIRADALAKLDFFKTSIPGLFNNRLQVKHLDKQAAENAIRKPIYKYNEINGDTYDIEDQLVERVLKDLEARNVKFSFEGQAKSGSEAEQSQIEMPYLQLVMRRIWEKERELNSKKLRLETLTTVLGGSQEIVNTHLDDVMNTLTSDQRDLAAAFVHFTVTRYGTKIAADPTTLATWAELSGKELEIKNILESLGTGPARIYRRVVLQTGFAFGSDRTTKEADFFEIYHDALIPSLLSWRQRYTEARNKELTELRIKTEEEEKRQQLLRDEEEKRRQLVQKHARQRKIAVLVAVLTIPVIILIGFLTISNKTLKAENQARAAENNARAAKAQAEKAEHERHLADQARVAEATKNRTLMELRKVYEEDLGYYRSMTEILEYLHSKKRVTKNVAFNRLEHKARDGELSASDKTAFLNVLEKFPEEEKTSDAWKELHEILLKKQASKAAPQPAEDSFVVLRIHYQLPFQHDQAEHVKTYLENQKDKNIFVVGIESVGAVSVFETELRFFYQNDKDQAVEVVKLLDAFGIKSEARFSGARGRARPNEFELWFPRYSNAVSSNR